MENNILANMGIDPLYLIVLLFLIQILLFVLLINVNMKYTRLKTSYASFMRGKDGKTLESSVLDRFDIIDEIAEMAKQNRAGIRELRKLEQNNYQKVGIVKYDAFHEMGGNLSFALTMLDSNNNGWILNAMHSREGCYTYIKEVVNGQSYIELAEEEKESLERAVYQEAYGLDIEDVDMKEPKPKKKRALWNDKPLTAEEMEQLEKKTGKNSAKSTGKLPRTTGSIPRTTGPISRTTGSIPKTTGKIPRTTGKLPRTTGSIPKSEK